MNELRQKQGRQTKRRTSAGNTRTTGGPEFLPEEIDRSLSPPARTWERERSSYAATMKDTQQSVRRSNSAPARKDMSTLGRPGAVAVRGTAHHSMTENTWTTNSTERDPERRLSPSSFGAVLVDTEEEERRIEKRLPLAETVKEQPWYRRPVTISSLCLVLLVVIIVSVNIPLKKQREGSPSATTPSLAPTSLALITVVVQLDDKPWETGWMLECDEGVIESAPPGTYGIVSGRPIFCIEYEAVVPLGSDCQLTITDSGGDCGCDQPAEGKNFCRLFGGNEDLLPEPARLVNNSTVLGLVTTCFHVEFASNMNDTSTLECSVYQDDSSSDCCF